MRPAVAATLAAGVKRAAPVSAVRALAPAARAAARRSYFAETLRVKPTIGGRTVDEPWVITDHTGKAISPWHDIPLRRAGAHNVFNMVCEIPRGTTPKFEVRGGGGRRRVRDWPAARAGLARVREWGAHRTRPRGVGPPPTLAMKRRRRARWSLQRAAGAHSASTRPRAPRRHRAPTEPPPASPRPLSRPAQISTDKELNPIVQDRNKDGSPRFYAFKSLTNYGAIPQTYEDPDHKDEWTGLLGDGDPLDVCEIGSKLAEVRAPRGRRGGVWGSVRGRGGRGRQRRRLPVR